MEITVKCPSCGAALPVAAASAPSGVRCGRCGREIALGVSQALRDDTAVDVCPVCEGPDFYRRKDFDPKVGLSVVVAGAIVSGIFYWFGQDLIAYGILGSAVLLDLIVYGRLGDVTVCYRCHAEFRGRYPRTAPPFDLHTADALEPEWERKIGRR
jgi:hypothetical protein